VEDRDGNIIPKIKVSENVGKITNPGFKAVYRLLRPHHRQGRGGLHLRPDEVWTTRRPSPL
jgi:nicotinate phosphoribosyltransferase